MTAWDLSCPDWEARLRAGKVPFRDLQLTSHGNRAVAVYDRLRLSDVPGVPRLGPRLTTDPPDSVGDASGEWFREIVRAIFGSWDPVARKRYIRELFNLVPKKNSKTTYGALGMMLTALLLNERPHAQFLMTAPVQDTADLAFSAISGAIELDPVLQAKLHVRDHLKEIIHRQTKAKLEIVTFEPSVLTGRKVVGALIDEVHVLGKMPRAGKALLQLRGGMEPFPEAFLAMITTQSDEPPAGAFKEELEAARDVRDGKREAATLPVLYEFSREMQQDPDKPWRDTKNWHLVTPNRGRSIQLQSLEVACINAEAKGEQALREWASQHLNIEIGLALHANRWAGTDHWEGAAWAPVLGQARRLTLEELLTRSEVVVAGVDGGGLDDLLGFGVIGREIETGRWLHWGKAWAHRCVLQRRKDIASLLLDFEAQGDLTIVPDDSDEDIEELAALVAQLEASGLLDRIGVDQAGIGAVVDAITDLGIPHDRIIGVPQGWRLVGAIKTVERKLAAKTLVHAGQPIMGFAVSNAKAEARGNAVIITKQIAGSAKIDPLMALFDCAALMAMNPQPKAKKYQAFFV